MYIAPREGDTSAMSCTYSTDCVENEVDGHALLSGTVSADVRVLSDVVAAVGHVGERVATTVRAAIANPDRRAVFILDSKKRRSSELLPMSDHGQVQEE